jgi:hypothetical protein
MRAFIKITGDDLPFGGMLLSPDPETKMDEFLADLARAYPGMDITDVTPEPGE